MNEHIFLIHWNEEEVEAKAAALRDLGWQVDLEAADGARAAKRIIENPPRIVLIYLTRLPSHGRETAKYLRSRKATQTLPMIFVDGHEDAITKTQEQVSNAVYTDEENLAKILQQESGKG